VRLELRTELARSLAGDAADAYPFLAQLLGLEERIGDLTGDSVQHETFYWLDRLVETLARERPVCFVLDDLHWSDDATLALVDELLPSVDETAVAFVLIHRSDPDHTAWQLVDRARRRFRRCFTEIEVEPLADSETRALAEADAGGRLPDALAEALGERAGGNPYFVGEAVRDLRERGALVEQDGRLVLVGEAEIPAALQEALQARLDRLDSGARSVITTAAVVGRSFGLPLLERLLPKTRLPSTLSELQWLQLVVEERSGPAPEYRFRHGLVQEAAYGALTEPGRRALHLAVAEALVELHRDSPAEVYGLLGHHFAEADESERAVEYLLRAGDAARAQHAQEEAIGFYRRALGFMDRTGDDARARPTLLRIALTSHLAFDYVAANKAFGEAFARPAVAPVRLEPTEDVAWAVESAGAELIVPGLAYSAPTWFMGPNLFRGLLSIGRDLAIEPDLAERISVSDDGRLYWVTVRPDARWSDGEPVTAGDIAFGFARTGAEGPAAVAASLDGVDAAAIDGATLEIRLTEPRNHFLYILGSPAFAAWPRHVYERDGPEWHRAVPPVGNGPFVLASRDLDHLVLEAAPTWHGARGNVRRVDVMLAKSWRDVAHQWRAGKIDVLHGQLARYVASAEEVPVELSPSMFTWYLGFNASRSPVDDARVRRAAAHAIDRNVPAAALGATATATGGLIPPPMAGHSQRVAPAFDPDRARALLADAGGVRGEIVLAHLGLWADAVENVAAQLESVGLRVRLLRLASDYDFEASLDDQHAFLWAWEADSPDPAGGLLSPIRLTTPVYRDEELDALLARAESLRDQDERLRIYRAYERRWIGELAAVIPLAYADSALMTRPGITGMWTNQVGMSTFAEAVVERQ
jgi:ABC-type transport system substrate-binding protein